MNFCNRNLRDYNFITCKRYIHKLTVLLIQSFILLERQYIRYSGYYYVIHYLSLNAIHELLIFFGQLLHIKLLNNAIYIVNQLPKVKLEM